MAERLTFDEILPRLRCPRTRTPLRREGDRLVSEDGRQAYPLVDGVPDLRAPPDRLRIDLPWFDPFSELDAVRFEPPTPLPADRTRDLPHHLDRFLAAVPGERGEGRWLLEVGCGERGCEPWFAERGFRYVGFDFDRRGPGPHVQVDAHNLPVADGSFDLYLSLAVYEHLVAPVVAAREGFRALRPGGLFLGTAAFVYKFHDRASFHHMTHAGLLWTLRTAGFEVLRLWPDWRWIESVPQMAFGPGGPGRAFAWAARLGLEALERSYLGAQAVARRLARKPALDRKAREAEMAGSLSFVARKPGTNGDG